MNASFWLQLRWLLWLCIFLVATVFTPSVIVAYDVHKQTTVVYDSRGESNIGVDAVLLLATGEKKNGARGDRNGVSPSHCKMALHTNRHKRTNQRTVTTMGRKEAAGEMGSVVGIKP